MTLDQFLSAGVSATSLLILGMYLNYRGQLLWRAQVDKEVQAIVSGYEAVIDLYKEQLSDERNDKNSWKDTARSFMPVTSRAIDGVVEVAKKVGP
jgi:hypothetical protein